MDKIKRFFANPTHWQRLAILSVISMFISHLILLSMQGAKSNGEVDFFAVIAGAVILLFVVGWSALNGSSDTKFISRTVGVVCASFEIHRLGYSYIWPEKLNELQEPTFYVFGIILIAGLLLQSLFGKTVSDCLVMIKEKAQQLKTIKLPKIAGKSSVATTLLNSKNKQEEK
jgi:ABC-type polysaccharide/polyol phosphate export permease